MWIQRLRQHLPTREALSKSRLLQPVRHWIRDRELWRFTRRSTSIAVFIGLFCAYIPLPAQMLIAAALAIATRSNIPIAVGGVWITNPFTLGPMFFFSYKLGSWILGTEMIIAEDANMWTAFWTRLGQIWLPLTLGSAICGLAAGAAGYAIVQLLWRIRLLRKLKLRRVRRNLREPSA